MQNIDRKVISGILFKKCMLIEKESLTKISQNMHHSLFQMELS